MDFIQKTSLAAAGIWLGTACNSGSSADTKVDAHPNTSKDRTFGHGSHKYLLRKGWGRGNAQPIKDAHEMVQSRDGRFFLITNETRNNILIFNGDGKVIDTWGNSFPGGHGLTLNDEGGEEFLYITDHDRHQVFKTTLDGRVIHTIDAPLDADGYSNIDQFRPTETAVDSKGNIYVADGYGAQWISVFSQDGHLKHVFGGPGAFQNVHGICLDERTTEPTLLLSAREQNVLKRYSLDGTWLKDIPLDGAMINRAVVCGEHTYLSVLKTSHRKGDASGFVLILDNDDQIVSCPSGASPGMIKDQNMPLHQTIELFQHPHDVCVDANENLYIPQWNAGGVYPIMLERI